MTLQWSPHNTGETWGCGRGAVQRGLQGWGQSRHAGTRQDARGPDCRPAQGHPVAQGPRAELRHGNSGPRPWSRPRGGPRKATAGSSQPLLPRVGTPARHTHHFLDSRVSWHPPYGYSGHNWANRDTPCADTSSARSEKPRATLQREGLGKKKTLTHGLRRVAPPAVLQHA